MSADPFADLVNPPAPKEDPLHKRKIGALWTKTSASGNRYLAGRIKVGNVDVGIIVLPNPYKEQAKHPDYNVILMREEGVQKL